MNVSLANFQVSDDIVGRSLGQIGGRKGERERERVYITKIVHGGERSPCCCIADTGRYPLSERDFETRQARRVCPPPPPPSDA